MVEFIDKSPTNNGTPINRANMMAIQGFQELNTEFLEDGSIVQTDAEGHTLTTVFDSDGSIREIFQGEKKITKITKFLEDGSILEELE